MFRVVYTDLDGTLLDHTTYSFSPATEALELLRANDTPLVICTSKTRAEIEHWRELLHNTDPFISENGGAVFVPRDYFETEYEYDKKLNGYNVIELGTPAETLRSSLEKISNDLGIATKTLSGMSPQEVSELTGLDIDSAVLAQQREYDEPFIIPNRSTDIQVLKDAIYNAGWSYTKGGRFHHIMGTSNKGRAVRILTDLYAREHKLVETIGIGDSLNDIPLLESVDTPVLVQKPDGTYEQDAMIENMIHADGIGPGGWNNALLKLFVKNGC